MSVLAGQHQRFGHGRQLLDEKGMNIAKREKFDDDNTEPAGSMVPVLTR